MQGKQSVYFNRLQNSTAPCGGASGAAVTVGGWAKSLVGLKLLLDPSVPVRHCPPAIHPPC